jgi:hypothetical protein
LVGREQTLGDPLGEVVVEAHLTMEPHPSKLRGGTGRQRSYRFRQAWHTRTRT